MKNLALGAGVLLLIMVSGCNTVKGAGQDIQKAGQAIENAVKKK